MTSYTPGSPYKLGYDTRMNGGDKVSNTFENNSVYWQEWLAGWDDAHQKIINEARERNKCPKLGAGKEFIQD